MPFIRTGEEVQDSLITFYTSLRCLGISQLFYKKKVALAQYELLGIIEKIIFEWSANFEMEKYRRYHSKYILCLFPRDVSNTTWCRDWQCFCSLFYLFCFSSVLWAKPPPTILKLTSLRNA